jgi:uncharacterized repeat protein (TIGR01451 family)
MTLNGTTYCKLQPERVTFAWCSLACFVILLIASGMAGAQTASNTLLATGFSLPYGAQVLKGSAINPKTGQPFRHLWTGDAGGLCRLDPDLDSGGPFTTNAATCVTTVAGIAFTPGRMAYDPLTNTIYSVEDQGGANVARYHFLPDGDAGQGLVSPAAEFLGDANGCGLVGSFPWALALGPDGNLYISFKTSGNLVRVMSPSSASVPCSNVQVMGTTPDTRRGLGISFVGHDIWGADIRGLFRISNADQCFTPADNFTPCHGTTLLKTLIPGVFTLTSDQAYPAVNGDSLYIAETQNSIVKVSGLSSSNGGGLAIDNNYAEGFLFLISVAFDNTSGGPVIFVGDDPGQEAGIAGGGRYYAVSRTPTVPTVPGTPIGVTASAGDSQAFVTWLSGGGSLATSYTVRNATASNGILVPDLVVPVSGSTLTPAVSFTGLSNGIAYTFVVSASNAQGSSPFSAPSNSVTPFAITPPGAPTGVIATAGDTQATVQWTPPASNGNSAITSYTVTARINGAATRINATAGGSSTSAVVTGLTDGTSYTFTVHASNIKGAGPESTPSNSVIPVRPLGATDIAISISGASQTNAGGNVPYTLTVNNLGPSFAPQVTVTDFVPAGATFVSATTSQGACAALGSQLQCNLGGIIAGGSATLTVTLNVTAAITNTVTVNANDASANPLLDPVPVNNTASANTGIAPLPTTTDLQVTGSAQNGGPTAGPETSDTLTWQIKNGQNSVANAVQFNTTLPPGLTFNSVSTSIGTCQPLAAGASGTITCTAASIGGGQTMTVTVNFGVPAAGSFISSGQASFIGTDTNNANNSFEATINAK